MFNSATVMADKSQNVFQICFVPSACCGAKLISGDIVCSLIITIFKKNEFKLY
jgi:hypothetical protein